MVCERLYGWPTGASRYHPLPWGKFFPASLAGGIPMLLAFGSVFREMHFMPTGGISAENLPGYLAMPNVLACGRSWLTPNSSVKNGDFAAIEILAREAVEISKQSRNQD